VIPAIGAVIPANKPKLDFALVKASSPSSLLVVLRSLRPQSAAAGLTPDDKVVFTLDDGSLHRTSRALLMAHSTFFANLFSVPPPSTGESGSIPLPSVSRAGLRLVLALLTFLGPSPNATIHRATLRAGVEMYRPYFSQRDLIASQRRFIALMSMILPLSGGSSSGPFSSPSLA
jgi:hypothetical protein